MNMRTFLGRVLIGLLIVTDFIADSLIDLAHFVDDAAEGIKESLRDLGYEVTEVSCDDN
jgi:hypothetical protein